MSHILQSFSEKHGKASVPKLRSGYIVKVHQKIKEGDKTRIQVFQGTIIAVNPGHGVDETFTVRKISEGIGVEKVFPIHSPNVVKIEVMRAQKVRRAKLNFLRKLSGKSLRLKEVSFRPEEKTFAVEAEEEATEEVVEESSEKEEKNEKPVAEKTEEARDEASEKKEEPKKESAAKESSEQNDSAEEEKTDSPSDSEEKKKEEEKK
ncbi:MAG: 50S ribosomal protein L19 [Candidatus Gracilibacteria bacterium]|nr:50S ribosomal protein L19 [Candidatus Gracilibacteria bacterium]